MIQGEGEGAVELGKRVREPGVQGFPSIQPLTGLCPTIALPRSPGGWAQSPQCSVWV